MKRLCSACLALQIAAAGCGQSSTPRTEPPVIQVTTARVRAEDVAAPFEAGGVIRARATAPIASRILAPVIAVHVRAGDRVRRGAPLVTLDGWAFEAAQARARASAAAGEESVRAAEGGVQGAEATAVLARATYDRLKTLHEKRSATAQELDQAAAGFKSAEAQVQSARANLASAVAARTAAGAAADEATAAATYATLTAPFDGVVAERLIDPGAMASPGVTLLTLEDPTAHRLEVTVDESRASSVSIGTTARVILRAPNATESTITGVVSEIARVEPASHTFVMKLDLPAAAGVISGAFGRAIFAGSPKSTLLVPASAVVRRGQLMFAFVVDGDNHTRLQPISPGAATDDAIEVLAGLFDRDRVVLNPPAQLAEGARVTEASR